MNMFSKHPLFKQHLVGSPSKGIKNWLLEQMLQPWLVSRCRQPSSAKETQGEQPGDVKVGAPCQVKKIVKQVLPKHPFSGPNLIAYVHYVLGISFCVALPHLLKRVCLCFEGPLFEQAFLNSKKAQGQPSCWGSSKQAHTQISHQNLVLNWCTQN